MFKYIVPYVFQRMEGRSVIKRSCVGRGFYDLDYFERRRRTRLGGGSKLCSRRQSITDFAERRGCETRPEDKVNFCSSVIYSRLVFQRLFNLNKVINIRNNTCMKIKSWRIVLSVSVVFDITSKNLIEPIELKLLIKPLINRHQIKWGTIK